MTSYQPLPNDVFFIAGSKPVTVLRVFPTEIVTSQEGMEDKKTPLDLFHTQLENAVKRGAHIEREGIQIYPPQTMNTTTPEQGLTGSSNTHARLSPSDSKRWTNCTASIAYQEANAHRVIDSSSREADEGTQAHEWAAKTLMEEITISQIPLDFREPVESYVLHCRDIIPNGVRTHLDTCLSEADLGFDPPDHAFFVEEQIPLFYQPTETGTADFLALESQGSNVSRLWGRDYKHGAGVLVTTAENTQLAIYIYSAIVRLSGAYKFSDDTIVDLAVVQPRHRESEDQDSWVITLGDLRTFCESITSQAEVAREAADIVRTKIKQWAMGEKDVSCQEVIDILENAESPAVFNPSEGDSGACRWCKCKAFCSARIDAITEGMIPPDRNATDYLTAMPDLTKTEDKLPLDERIPLRGLSTDDATLVKLIAKRKAWLSYLSDVEEYLEARLLNGESITGIKLVDGREGNRAWGNSDEVDSWLKNQGLKQEERYDFKLKSPATIEKVLKDKLKTVTRTKNRFNELITRSPAKKKLAISDDKREAVSPLIAAMPDESFEV
jgi:hypothetical protein